MKTDTTNLLLGKRILVVEDTDSNFGLIKYTLSHTGLSIDRALNGEQALQMISGKNVYNLIIMDLRLPGMDGYNVTRKIREIDQNIPIIANTAQVVDGEKERALKNGCNAYLPKPTDQTIFVETIVNYILNS